MRTSRSRSARRERCRRARVRESPATRLASRLAARAAGSVVAAAVGRCGRVRVVDRLLPAIGSVGRSPLVPSDGAASGAAGAASRLVVGLGQEPFLGSRRPPPVELRTGAADASRPHERPRSAREQDGRDQRRAPSSVRETTGGHRPGHQREAQDRDRRDVEQHPHPGPGDRLVDDARRREQRDDHQDDGAQALGPGRPAEEHPPHDNRQRAQQSPEQS